MKVKFNKFERVAGLFVLTAFVSALIIGISVAVKRGWFEARINYYTVFESAEGIHPGAQVQIAGLRAGSVESVELQSDSTVLVKYVVLARYQERVRGDSIARLVRPFIIGDRILEITVGTDAEQMLAHGTEIPSVYTADIMSLLSGRNLAPVLETMSGLTDNLKIVIEAFLNPDRVQTMIRTFDQLEPLVNNFNAMSSEITSLSDQMTKDRNLARVMANLRVTTDELNTILPEFSKNAPVLASEVSQLVANLAELTHEFKVLLPALAEVGPDLPHSTRRALEALDEAVVLMKALQKNYFLRGSVDEVRSEEEKIQRLPAAEDTPAE